jgi:hypothetical protein
MSSKIFATMSLMALCSISSVAGDPASRQIGPGGAGSVGHGASGSLGEKPHKILNSALTPETRQTLQQAMNSSGAAPAK